MYSTVVSQNYKARVMDEDILRGNSAILKCQIPSFVADFVEVVSWETDDGEAYTTSNLGKVYGNA